MFASEDLSVEVSRQVFPSLSFLRSFSYHWFFIENYFGDLNSVDQEQKDQKSKLLVQKNCLVRAKTPFADQLCTLKISAKNEQSCLSFQVELTALTNGHPKYGAEISGVTPISMVSCAILPASF